MGLSSILGGGGQGGNSPLSGLMSGGLLGMLANIGKSGQQPQGQPAPLPFSGAPTGVSGTPAGLAGIGPPSPKSLPTQLPGQTGSPQFV